TMWYRVSKSVRHFESALVDLWDLPLAMAVDPDSHVVWIRAEVSCSGSKPMATIDEISSRLSVLPGQRYERHEDGRLRIIGQRLSTTHLPENLHWRPLAEVMRLKWPRAGVPKQSSDPPVQLRLERGGLESSIAGLLVNLNDLAKWVETAAEIRLRRLKWIYKDSLALVAGHPPPPLPGVAFGCHENIWIPMGQSWVPNIEAAQVRRVFQCDASETLVWRSTHQCEKLPRDAWSALSRASVREVLKQ
ncbi:MAG: hypothetical protein AAF958_18715, partial [Planctomycetota bacterium]